MRNVLSVKQRFRIEKSRALRLLAKDAHSDWMDECVPALMDMGKDQIVAVAACLNMWRQAWEETHPDGADDPGPDRPDSKQLLVARSHLARAWDESEHPRVPAGSGDDSGQFAPSGGGTSSSKPGKGKGKKVKKEDFDKAKITIAGDKARQDKVIEKWNEKIGEDPAAFKQKFMGGLNGDMAIEAYGVTGTFSLSGHVQNDQGSNIGTYTRELNLDSKSAYSSYFQLNATSRNADIGKKMLAGNVATYRELGLEKVRVHANIDVGGYAWAKYGYVPTQESWNQLRAKLEHKLGGGSTPSSSGNTTEADDWSMLSSDRQDDVRDTWMRDSYEEYLRSEQDNWRESGQAKADAKSELASMYGGGDIPEWANDAFDAAREYREEHEQSPIPYSNKQLYDAITLDYESYHGDGSDDPKIEFDDDKLQEPTGYDASQGTLPGIDPLDPASFLTKDMRERIETKMIKAFDDKAEEDADDIEPPDYLADSVTEYQDESWSSMDDSQKLEYAVRYGLADIEIEDEDEDEDEDDGSGSAELFPPEKDSLLAALHDRDPKAIWKVADDPRGKPLLLGSDWMGALNLTDPEAMKRFDAYVGKAKHG